MINLADLCLVGLVLAYSLNLAPMMFESFTSDRIWASNPPDSFHMFLGQYGQKTAHYWRVVSPLAAMTFIPQLHFQLASRRQDVLVVRGASVVRGGSTRNHCVFRPRAGGVDRERPLAFSGRVAGSRTAMDIAESLQERGRFAGVWFLDVCPPGSVTGSLRSVDDRPPFRLEVRLAV